MFRRPLTCRTTLLLFTLLVVVAPVGVAAAVVWVVTGRGTEDLSARVMRQKIGWVDVHVENLLRRATDQEEIARRVLAGRRPRADDMPAVFAALAPGFAVNREFAYLGYGDTATGDYGILRRMPDGTDSLRVYALSAAGGPVIRDYPAAAGGFGPPATLPYDGYDFRTRPFFAAARDAGRPVWTDTYAFWKRPDRPDVAGLSYVAPQLTGGTVAGVIDVDFDTAGLSAFLKTLEDAGPGYAFLVETRGDGSRRVIAHPDFAARTGATFPSAADFGDAADKAAVAALAPAGGVAAFAADGRDYFAAYGTPAGENRPRWTVVAVVPADAVAGGVPAARRAAGAAVVAVAGFAGLAAVYLSRRVVAPVHALAAYAAKVGTPTPGAPPPAAGPAEIRDLAAAFARAADRIGDRELAVQYAVAEEARARDALAASERKFEALFRLGPVSLALTRYADGTVVDVNAGFEALYGYAKAEAVGRTSVELGLLAGPDERAELAGVLRRDGRVRDLARHRTRRTGEPIHTVSNADRIDLDGVPHLLVATLDVTARVRAEAALKEANATLERKVAARTAELAAVNAELEAFCYSVSHDLRAPLRSIDGFGRVLEEDAGPALDADGRDALRRIRAATKRMGELIDALLTLSRVGRTEMVHRRVDVSAVARQTLDALAAADPGRDVDVEIEPGLAADADPNLLKIVLDNLLGNAWKYTGKNPRAKIRVTGYDDGGRPGFAVADDGAGFNPAYAGQLFQPFRRLHRADEFPGHGIGLATVRRVVARHGGAVSADGAVGRGATVRFTLGPAQGHA